jgi:hypothetical protein
MPDFAFACFDLDDGELRKASRLFFCGDLSFLGFFAVGVEGDDKFRFKTIRVLEVPESRKCIQFT